MKTLTSIIMLGVFVSAATGQGIFERFNEDIPKLAIPLLLCNSTPQQQFVPEGFGCAALYGVPTGTNTTSKWVCIVTAKHNLTNKKTGKPFSSLLAKINMPASEEPRYLSVPLRHEAPRNYWSSPSGLDLCVIPVPPEVINEAIFIGFNEDQIVTRDVWKDMNIRSGMLTHAVCIQPEYLDPVDFQLGETLATVRIGHLSRGGFGMFRNGKTFVRPHVIDMHAGPGNSGATVVVQVPFKKDKKSLSRPMFLGVVLGFKEEQGSYQPYRAKLADGKNRDSLSLNLVSAASGTTNNVALAIKTVANPDLSYVTPVHELADIRNSQEFKLAVALMARNKNAYQLFTHVPFIQKTHNK